MAASMAPTVGEEGGASLGITKVGKNTRRIEIKVGVKASFDTVWGVLTDYERWSEFVPELVHCKIIETKDNVIRLSQHSRTKTSIGLNYDSKSILEYKEKAIETLNPFGKKRELEFKMIEGDLQSYEGKWTIEQLNENGNSTITYLADLKTKMLIPISMVEGRLSGKLKANVLAIHQEAEKKSTSFH